MNDLVALTGPNPRDVGVSKNEKICKSVCAWERDVTQTRADPVFPFGSNIRKSSLGTNILAARLTNILLKKYPEKHLFTDNNKTVVNLEFHNFNVSFYPFFRTIMVMCAIQSFFSQTISKSFHLWGVVFLSKLRNFLWLENLISRTFPRPYL